MKTRMRRGFVAAGALAALALVLRNATAASGNLEISLCSPADHTFTTNVTNQYLPLGATARQPWALVGPDSGTTHGLLITDLGTTKTFKRSGWLNRVATEVIEEREWIDNGDAIFDPSTENLVEISRNYYAQTVTGTQPGTVCYFGEDTDSYDGFGNDPGHIVNHTGSWSVADPANDPGIFMPAAPKAGMHFFEESAPGIALDQASIVGVGTVTVPFGSFADAIRVKEFTSLEKGSTEYKSYAPNGVGPVIDDTLQRCLPGSNCLGAAALRRH